MAPTDASIDPGSLMDLYVTTISGKVSMFLDGVACLPTPEELAGLDQWAEGVDALNRDQLILADGFQAEVAMGLHDSVELVDAAGKLRNGFDVFNRHQRIRVYLDIAGRIAVPWLCRALSHFADLKEAAIRQPSGNPYNAVGTWSAFWRLARIYPFIAMARTIAFLDREALRVDRPWVAFNPMATWVDKVPRIDNDGTFHGWDYRKSLGPMLFRVVDEPEADQAFRDYPHVLGILSLVGSLTNSGLRAEELASAIGVSLDKSATALEETRTRLVAASNVLAEGTLRAIAELESELMEATSRVSDLEVPLAKSVAFLGAQEAALQGCERSLTELDEKIERLETRTFEIQSQVDSVLSSKGDGDEGGDLLVSVAYAVQARKKRAADYASFESLLDESRKTGDALAAAFGRVAIESERHPKLLELYLAALPACKEAAGPVAEAKKLASDVASRLAKSKAELGQIRNEQLVLSGLSLLSPDTATEFVDVVTAR